jgi:hypothetical protein
MAPAQQPANIVLNGFGDAKGPPASPQSVELETAATGITSNGRSACEGMSVTQAQNDLLGEKQPLLQFTT